MFKKLASWLVTAGLLVGLWQYQTIIDWWVLRNYQPEAEIVQLADQAAMTEEGRRFFYLSTPEVNDKLTFSQNCSNGELRQSLILGCYQGNQIYILRVDEPKLTPVMPVTAAHEMLHAAYLRLGDKEQTRINNLLEGYYRQVKDESLKKLIAEYQRTEPGQLLNELHSILPTEITKLPTELEDYYRRYFKDRLKVVKAFESYQAVFKQIEQNRQALLGDIAELKQMIESTEAQAAAAINRANNLSVQINQLRAQGRIEESNELVPAQNQAAAAANNLVGQTQTLIAQYNHKVKQINDLALLQQDLVNALDASELTPVAPR